MHMEALLEVLPEELHPKIKNLIEACGTKSEYCDHRLLSLLCDTDSLSAEGVDGCDTAYQSVACYIETDGPFIKSAVDDLLG